MLREYCRYVLPSQTLCSVWNARDLIAANVHRRPKPGGRGPTIKSICDTSFYATRRCTHGIGELEIVVGAPRVADVRDGVGILSGQGRRDGRRGAGESGSAE